MAPTYRGHLHYSLCWSRAGAGWCIYIYCLDQTCIWSFTSLSVQMSVCYTSRLSNSLCSRQQMVCRWRLALLIPTLEPSWAWLASFPGWPNVNALSCTQPGNFFLVLMAPRRCILWAWMCCVVQELGDFVIVEPQEHNSSVNGASILRRSADFSKMLLEYDFAAHGTGGAVR